MSADGDRVVLCATDAIPDPGSRGFEVEVDGVGVRLFVVRRDDRLSAFLNRCPHLGLGLEWMPDQFLDPDNHFIQCATHGALFRTEDGYCLRGPCAGQSLTAVAVLAGSGQVSVDRNALRAACQSLDGR